MQITNIFMEDEVIVMTIKDNKNKIREILLEDHVDNRKLLTSFHKTKAFS